MNNIFIHLKNSDFQIKTPGNFTRRDNKITASIN